MKTILNAFLATFFLTLVACNTEKEHSYNGKVEFTVLTKSSNSWDGTPLPKYTQGTPEVTVAKVVIPPYTKLPMHTHPYMNAGVITKGEITVISKSGEEKHLKAGEALIEVIESDHYGINNSNEPAELFIVYAGEKGQAITVIAGENHKH